MTSTPEIQLRPWTTDDLNMLQRTMGDPAMTEYLGGPESEEKLRERNQHYAAIGGTGKGRMFVITVDEEPAGTIGYWEHEARDGMAWETGYSVLPEFQSQGVATSATNLIIAETRNEKKHRWLHAYPRIDNAASIAISRKTGFELLGNFEYAYPPGNPITCNNWRFDLFGEDQGK